MSFFKEFKEDLKQAVDELIPTDEFVIPEEEPKVTDTVSETVEAVMAEARAQKQLDSSSEFVIPQDTVSTETSMPQEAMPSEETKTPVLQEEVYVVPEEVAAFVENIAEEPVMDEVVPEEMPSTEETIAGEVSPVEETIAEEVPPVEEAVSEEMPSVEETVPTEVSSMEEPVLEEVLPVEEAVAVEEVPLEEAATAEAPAENVSEDIPVNMDELLQGMVIPEESLVTEESLPLQEEFQQMSMDDMLKEAESAIATETPVEEELVEQEKNEEVVEEEMLVFEKVEKETTEQAVEPAVEATAEPDELIQQLNLESEQIAPEVTALEETVVEEPVVEENKIQEEMVKMEAETSVLDDGAPKSEDVAVITKGMRIRGDVESDGSIEVVGDIIGNVTCKGKLTISGKVNGNSTASEIFVNQARIEGEIISSEAVKVGNGTVILGNISATSAVIAGAVKGDIDVNGPVVVDASAVVVGNIKSRSVQINSGAVIEGTFSQCYNDEVDVKGIFSSSEE